MSFVDISRANADALMEQLQKFPKSGIQMLSFSTLMPFGDQLDIIVDLLASTSEGSPKYDETYPTTSNYPNSIFFSSTSLDSSQQWLNSHQHSPSLSEAGTAVAKSIAELLSKLEIKNLVIQADATSSPMMKAISQHLQGDGMERYTLDIQTIFLSQSSSPYTWDRETGVYLLPSKLINIVISDPAQFLKLRPSVIGIEDQEWRVSLDNDGGEFPGWEERIAQSVQELGYHAPRNVSTGTAQRTFQDVIKNAQYVCEGMDRGQVRQGAPLG